MGVLNARARVGVLGVAMVCAVWAFSPFLQLPFISDDYVQIQLGRDYGPVSGWQGLAHDALYRCRATSILLTHWTESLFGLEKVAYSASSLVLHILNILLVFSLGAWRIVGYRASAVAAVLFALYESHQEAVVWYSALPELLVFTFTLASVTSFIRSLRRPKPAGWYAASLILFIFALFSKESAVVVVPLTALVLWTERSLKDRWPWLIPYAVLAGIYTWLVFASAGTHLHFNDAGTFSLKAVFPLVLAHSAVRALWIWGAIAIAALLVFPRKRTRVLASVALAWIAISLLPYSFLTYMSRVPSRHLYLAAVGVALFLAAALLSRPFTAQGRVVAVIALLGFVATNVGYLRTRKYRQYEERSIITERLVEQARGASPPVAISCFPYSPVIVELAVRIRLHPSAVVAVQPGERPGLDLCTASHFAVATKGQTIVLDW